MLAGGDGYSRYRYAVLDEFDVVIGGERERLRDGACARVAVRAQDVKIQRPPPNTPPARYSLAAAGVLSPGGTEHNINTFSPSWESVVKARRVTPRLLAVMIGVLASTTCHDPVAPTGPPGITIVAGAGVADSIDARPAQALLVEVHTAEGATAGGSVVRFSGLPTSGGPFPQTSVRVGRIDAQPTQSFAVDTTDGHGRARVLVALGAVAGQGGVEITVPEFGFSDTAGYVIHPGNGVRVVSLPEDTVVAVSHSFALSASLRDRYGNARQDPVIFEGDSASATVSPSGTVTGAAIGRARIRVHDTSGRADTTWVAVVPQATIAAITPTGIAIVDLDGSNYRAIPGVAAAAWVDWNAAGDTLVFSSSDYDSWLYVSTLTGPPRRLIADSIALLSEYRPQYSGDGQWIYFGGRAFGQSQAIWRVRSDGSSLERIGPASGSYDDAQPAPSSDGLRSAFLSTRCCYPNLGLFVLDIQTGLVDSLVAAALTPRWSPGDSLIGFVMNGIWVIRPDGQGLRLVTAIGRPYDQGFDWSPSGEWIIARGPSEYLELIRVADGLTLLLPHLRNLARPAWRP